MSSVHAAVAVSYWIEAQTGWSIKEFVDTLRRYLAVQVQAGTQVLTAIIDVWIWQQSATVQWTSQLPQHSGRLACVVALLYVDEQHRLEGGW